MLHCKNLYYIKKTFLIYNVFTFYVPDIPLVNLLGTLGDEGISPRRCASSLAGTLGDVGIVLPSLGTVRLPVGEDWLSGDRRFTDEQEGAKQAMELLLERSERSVGYILVSRRLSTLPDRRRGVTSLKTKEHKVRYKFLKQLLRSVNFYTVSYFVIDVSLNFQYYSSNAWHRNDKQPNTGHR